jgi:hypothetical protein
VRNLVCDRCSLPIPPGAVHVTHRHGLPAVIEHTDCARARPQAEPAAVAAPKPQRDWLAPGRLP